MKINVYNTFSNLYGFMDYYKLVISKEKFVKITSVLNSKKMNKINNEEIEEEDSLRPKKIIENIDLKTKIKRKLELANENKESVKKEFQNDETFVDHNENIALAFSLDPLQLVDVIRHIDNANLREFYYLIMLYMFEDVDYTLITSYLERETKFTLLNKYKYYSMYTEEKDMICKQNEQYENEKSYFSYIYNYSKFMKEKMEKFTELREKSLKKLQLETEEQIKKLKEQEEK